MEHMTFFNNGKRDGCTPKWTRGFFSINSSVIVRIVRSGISRLMINVGRRTCIDETGDTTADEVRFWVRRVVVPFEFCTLPALVALIIVFGGSELMAAPICCFLFVEEPPIVDCH